VHPAKQPSLEKVRVIGSYCCHQFPHQEQGNTGAVGHESDVTALSVPRFAQAIKKTAIADGVKLMSDVPQASTGVEVSASSASRRR